MNSLTDAQIRAAFVNTSTRERRQASVPDLDALDWESLDYLGWQDERRPQLSYLVADSGAEPVGVLLSRPEPGARARRKAMCTLCEDIVETQDVSMFNARRGGAAGRKGDTLGTMICTEFRCSANVRRRPTMSEVGSLDAADIQAFTDRRIQGLQLRVARFVGQVSATA